MVTLLIWFESDELRLSNSITDKSDRQEKCGAFRRAKSVLQLDVSKSDSVSEGIFVHTNNPEVYKPLGQSESPHSLLSLQ